MKGFKGSCQRGRAGVVNSARLFYAEGTMTDIAIFWDASQLWGLLVWRAAEAFGLPYRLVKAKEIAQGALSDKTSLLLVPGGTARHKSAALGEKGREAVRAWVRGGGCYVGFCGGAGLGLSDAADPARTAEIGTGLCLCPWHRAEIGERVQHFVSGHVRVRFQSGHPLVPEFFSEPVAPGSEPAIPIWWPGRFAASSGGPDDGVDVLARYAGSDPRTCPPDLCVADLPLSSLSPAVLEQWIELYGVSLAPGFLNGQPCALHGRYGKGSYTLSYSHLETPGSPDANRWFAHILRMLTGFEPRADTVPAWRPGEMPVLWHDPDLLEARRGMEELIRLGIAHDQLFERAPWLTGWRSGVPGAGLNALFMGLCVLTGVAPSAEAERLWASQRVRFGEMFSLFRQGVEGLLLGLRLATIMPEEVPRKILAEQRLALFGSAMQGGGLYKELMDMVDALLFLSLGKPGGCDDSA